MELIKNFGIDPILLVAQIVNFLIVLYLLRKFLYKPVLDLLKKRQDSIREGVEKSEEARIRLEKVLQEEKKILTKAQAQAKKIVEDAKLQSLELSGLLEENAKKQSEKILKDANDQIRREAMETEKRLTLNVSSLAIKFLQKALLGTISEKEQKEITQRALKNIKQIN